MIRYSLFLCTLFFALAASSELQAQHTNTNSRATQYIDISYGQDFSQYLGKKVCIKARQAEFVNAHPMFGGPSDLPFYLTFGQEKDSRMVAYYDPDRVLMPEDAQAALLVYGTMRGQTMQRGNSEWVEYYISIDKVGTIEKEQGSPMNGSRSNNTPQMQTKSIPQFKGQTKG